jgi:hypothetical protein
MGTLTADCPRLDEHCPHKLATSCRLTSTPNCCACADERPHSRLYRVYIDGVGYVQRGTRWQSYCWFCKGLFVAPSHCHHLAAPRLFTNSTPEFWTNRLAATDPPLEASQTKIPLVPDQTEFLERWKEYHQGYRLVPEPDGTEGEGNRVPILGEPLADVSPGFLPRTLTQLPAGDMNDATRPENRTRRRRLTSEDQRPEEPRESIDDALDSLLAEVSEDESPLVVPARTMDRRTMDRFEAGLAEILISRTDILPVELRLPRSESNPAGVVEDEATAAEQQTPVVLPFRRRPPFRVALARHVGTNPAEMLGDETTTMQQQTPGTLHDRRVRRALARRDGINPDQVQTRVVPDPDSASSSENRARVERNLQRTRDRLVRVFGSRDDVQRDDYESPLSTLYGRAEARYQQAEERRATGNTIAPSTQNMSARERREVEEQILWGIMQESERPTTSDTDISSYIHSYRAGRRRRARDDSGLSTHPPDRPYMPMLQSQPPFTTSAADSSSNLMAAEHSIADAHSLMDRYARLHEAHSEIPFSQLLPPPNARRIPSPPRPTLDTSDRPPPLTDAQMMKNLACQVCYAQIADIAVVPCGHMVMCQWCADVVVPVRHNTIPARVSNCPMCRKRIQQRFKVHIGG